MKKMHILTILRKCQKNVKCVITVPFKLSAWHLQKRAVSLCVNVSQCPKGGHRTAAFGWGAQSQILGARRPAGCPRDCSLSPAFHQHHLRVDTQETAVLWVGSVTCRRAQGQTSFPEAGLCTKARWSPLHTWAQRWGARGHAAPPHWRLRGRARGPCATCGAGVTLRTLSPAPVRGNKPSQTLSLRGK